MKCPRPHCGGTLINGQCHKCCWPNRRENLPVAIPEEVEEIGKKCKRCKQRFIDISVKGNRRFCKIKECVKARRKEARAKNKKKAIEKQMGE